MSQLSFGFIFLDDFLCVFSLYWCESILLLLFQLEKPFLFHFCLHSCIAWKHCPSLCGTSSFPPSLVVFTDVDVLQLTVCIRHTHKQLIFPYQVEFCFWKLLIITTIVCERLLLKQEIAVWIAHLYSENRENHWWWRAPSHFCTPVVTFEILCHLSAELPVFHIWSLLVARPLVMLEVRDFFSWQMWGHWSRDFSCGFHKPACFGLLFSWKLLNSLSSW